MMTLFKKTKSFFIGQNKIGTTSIESVLQSLGYKSGKQEKVEMLLKDWAILDFKRIIKLCKAADAFQDVPFSNDFTYVALDHAFPESKFILTTELNSDNIKRNDSLDEFFNRPIFILKFFNSYI